jgi:uncharacterized protein YnzC (UPF0291/DUF896 family)
MKKILKKIKEFFFKTKKRTQKTSSFKEEQHKYRNSAEYVQGFLKYYRSGIINKNVPWFENGSKKSWLEKNRLLEYKEEINSSKYHDFIKDKNIKVFAHNTENRYAEIMQIINYQGFSVFRGDDWKKMFPNIKEEIKNSDVYVSNFKTNKLEPLNKGLESAIKNESKEFGIYLKNKEFEIVFSAQVNLKNSSVYFGKLYIINKNCYLEIDMFSEDNSELLSLISDIIGISSLQSKSKSFNKLNKLI